MEHLATIRERLLAKLIDWGIFLIPPLSLYYMYAALMKLEIPLWVVATISSLFTGLLILFFLQCVLIGMYGRSLGKVVMRIRIVDAKSGKTSGVVQNLLLRTWVSALMMGNIGYFLANPLLAFRKERRCLHDYLAGTIVIKA